MQEPFAPDCSRILSQRRGSRDRCRFQITESATVSSGTNGECDDDQSRGNQEGDPHADGDGVGRGCGNVARPRSDSEDGPYDGCAGDQAQIARQIEHAGDSASLVRAGIGHDCSIVGRLEERIAGGDDDDGCDVTRNGEYRRQKG